MLKWTTNDPIKDALNLPKGKMAIWIGVWVEYDICPEDVKEAAEAFQKSNIPIEVNTQAGLIVGAYNQKLCFQETAPLMLV